MTHDQTVRQEDELIVALGRIGVVNPRKEFTT